MKRRTQRRGEDKERKEFFNHRFSQITQIMKKEDEKGIEDLGFWI